MAGPLQDSNLGTTLDGRYQIVALLGRGGMGNVYLAEETRLRRRCALKVLHSHLSHERANVERFLREAQTIAQFEHPNIVDIFSFGEEPNGVVFFAMELLTGEDLEVRIKRREEEPYTLHQGILWAIQVARAVAVVHDAGLIHRDLKVSNVFLARRRDGEEIVKLLDFGIARPETGSELTATGIALGTPSYMSPEQIENRGIDRRADIYSFGVVLYKLLTGQLPFTGDAIQVAVQHRDVAPPRPTALAPEAGISPELEAIILKAMAKRQEDRYQTIQEMEAALLQIVETEAPAMLSGALRALNAGSSMPHFSATRPMTLPPGFATLGLGDATPSSAAKITGPTSAMPVAPPPRRFLSRGTLYIITSASMLSVVILLAIMMLKGGNDAPPQDAPPPPTPALVAAPPAEDPQPTPPAQPEPAAQPDPPAQPDPQPTQTKVKPRSDPSPTARRPVSPRAQVLAKAAKCRKKHKAVRDPKFTFEYWVTTEGVANIAGSPPGALGSCLARSITTTEFEPKLALKQKIDL